MTATVYIAFGSNLEDRRAHIEKALSALERLATGPMNVSSLWQSAPVDMDPDTSWFLNGVVAFETELAPRLLLSALQSIERAGGRPADHGRNQPRRIDLDIICMGDLIVDDADLQLPHPRAGERRFVLAPLAEIAPDLVFPGESKTVEKLLTLAPDMAIRRVSDARDA